MQPTLHDLVRDCLLLPSSNHGSRYFKGREGILLQVVLVTSNAAKASISTGDLWIFCSFESIGLDIKLRESVLDEALEFDETARDLRIL